MDVKIFGFPLYSVPLNVFVNMDCLHFIFAVPRTAELSCLG